MTEQEVQIYRNYKKFSCGLHGWDIIENAVVERVNAKGIHIQVPHPNKNGLFLHGFSSFYAPLGSTLSVSIDKEFKNCKANGEIEIIYLFRVESVDYDSNVDSHAFGAFTYSA